MARRMFPDDRLAYSLTSGVIRGAVGRVATIYGDAAGTVLADILNEDGSANPTSTLTVDAYSRLPLFQGPVDGTDRLYGRIGTGPVVPLYARVDDRLDEEVAARAAGDAAERAYGTSTYALHTAPNTNPFDVVVARDDKNAGNFEQTSATAVALRLRQSGSGPIAKWRSGTSDVGFIQNTGEIKLIPASNGRAVTVNAASWAAGRTYGYGQVDYLFGGEMWTDASGSSPADPGGITYSKGFGLRANKTGKGNLDAFWVSLSHSGVDEVGIMIGDATTTGGGNAWGAHFALTANTAEANLYGDRTELMNNVIGSSKTQVGKWVRSLGSQPCTVGLLISGTGGWTDYINVRDKTDAVVLNMRGSDGALRTKTMQPLSDAGGNLGAGSAYYNQAHVYKVQLKATGLPASGLAAGLFVYDSAANKLKFYNGTAWETVSSA